MINRDYYLDRLIHNMWNGEIKVITGIHRCGKSVLLFDLFYDLARRYDVKGKTYFNTQTNTITLTSDFAMPD